MDGWTPAFQPYSFGEAWRSQFGPDIPPPRAWEHRDGRLAMVGREPAGPGDEPRWHVSVRWADPKTNAGRVPTWEELVDTAHELRPGVCFVIGVPPRSWWLNIHPHVLHLWEVRDDALVAQYRANAQGQEPT